MMDTFTPDTAITGLESMIVVEKPTKKFEILRIMDTLKDITQLKTNGYYPDHIILPPYYSHIADQILMGNVSLGDIDIKEFIMSFQYSLDDYLEISTAVENEKSSITPILPHLTQWHAQWRFRIFSTYTVFLTHYGTGGSYIHTCGAVILRTDRYNDFATIIHEIVYIGIEEVIVNKYKLSHWEKERVVDLICRDILSVSDQMQRPHDRTIETLNEFVTITTIDNLPKAIEEYLRFKQVANL